jgi:hypothetical protein
MCIIFSKFENYEAVLVISASLMCWKLATLGGHSSLVLSSEFFTAQTMSRNLDL